ncbi:MAG: hypothetical protein WC880_02910 [Candidatus Paceibacterota bacterium]
MVGQLESYERKYGVAPEGYLNARQLGRLLDQSARESDIAGYSRWLLKGSVMSRALELSRQKDTAQKWKREHGDYFDEWTGLAEFYSPAMSRELITTLIMKRRGLTEEAKRCWLEATLSALNSSSSLDSM